MVQQENDSCAVLNQKKKIIQNPQGISKGMESMFDEWENVRESKGQTK